MTAITLNLKDSARTLIEDWVRDGHYGSIEEVVEAGLHFVREQVEAHGWEPSAEDIAAIEEGRAQVVRGEGRPADAVFDELTERYRSWPR